MSIFLDKLEHVQVIINCQYSVSQMCTPVDMLAHNLGALYFDDIMSYNSQQCAKMAIIEIIIFSTK